MTHSTVQLRRWAPSPGDFVFALILFSTLVMGRRALFNDPGTFWHLRLGRDILATSAVPRVDSLTFTRFQEPWIDQSWGFDVLLAVVVDRAGWSAAAFLAALGLAWVYASLTRDLIAEGSSAAAAVGVATLAAMIGSIHFLVRPHLFTIAFVYLAFRLCRAQQREGGWAIAWIIPLTAALANLHGGFVALPLIVACAGAGRAISGEPPRFGPVGRYVLVFMGCCLASLLNPYGLELHRQIVRLLFTSGVTSLIDEYRSAPFGQPGTRFLELAVLALIALPVFSKRKIDRPDMVHVLVWLHLTLTSIRNAPLFAFAAAPVVAGLLDGLVGSARTEWAETPGLGWRRWAVAVACLTAPFALGIPIRVHDPARWPLNAVPAVDANTGRQRLFHEQDWGGLIASESERRRRTFIDDRFELFGSKAVIEYVGALGGGPEWDAIRDRDRIDAVWIKPDRGLARRLRHDPGWAVVHDDATSIVFERVVEPTRIVLESPAPRSSGATPLDHED